jgi:AAA+ ATPase superfamily predicted ATPase
MASIFIGRKNELASLKGLLRRGLASLVTVRGRRRIGKSRLIEEFTKTNGKSFMSFTGITPSKGVTAEDQRKEFVRQLNAQTGLSGIETKDWSDIFTVLYHQIDNKQIVLLFDEISWMAQGDPTFLGKLKIAWDTLFSKNNKLILILCGSVSSWIEKNIISSTGFLGRITLQLNVPELSLSESSDFLNHIGFKGSEMEKLMILSVTGGIPRYIELVNRDKSAEQNIKSLFFEPSSILLSEFDNIFNDLFGTSSDVYRKIVLSLTDGSLEYAEISHSIGYPAGGPLSEYIGNLLICGFISKDITWSLKSGEDLKLYKYRLSDNYLRFYLKYVMPNLNRIEKGQCEDIALSSLPGWSSIMGLQFKNLVLNNRNLIWQELNIRPEDIIADNPYFQRKTKAHMGCQIDYLIQTKYNALFACEIKFSAKELGSDQIASMQEKIDRLVLPKRLSCLPILIHVSGISDLLEGENYFTKTIDFRRFLN